MPQVTKSQIIYNEADWLAGLHPQYGSKAINQKFGKYARNQLAFNPFRNLGYAGNAYLNTTYTNYDSSTSRILNAVNDGQTAYGIESKNLLHQFNFSSKTLNKTSPWPHTITPHTTHTSVAGSDITTYYHNVSSTRVKSLFYSWNDNTDADVGRFDLTSTFDDDFMSTVPASGAVLTKDVAHPLIVGYDDILYIGNGRYLNAYDGATGTDGTYSEEVLTLPEDYEIIAMAKLQPRSLVIFAHKTIQYSTNHKNECKAFFWDYLSSDPYQIEDLYDNYVWDAFEYKGSVGCFTGGRGSYNKVKIFDGSEFTQVTKYLGTGPIHGGCDVNGSEIYWNVISGTNGIIYKYGNNDGLQNTLSAFAKVTAGTGYEPGFLKLFLQSAISASNGKNDASGSMLEYLNVLGYANEGLWYSDLLDIGNERININQVTVYFADEVTGGRTVSLSLVDRYGNYSLAGMVDVGTVISTDRIRRLKPIQYTTNILIPSLDGFGIELSWGEGDGSSKSPIISKIVIDYTPSKI